MKVRVLNATDIKNALPMEVAIDAMREAFSRISAHKAVLPLRSHITLLEYDGVAEFMPAYLPPSESIVIKIVSVYPRNRLHQLSTIHALVVVLDAKTGQPSALVEGEALTAIRTGAASGLATDLLARPDARAVAIFGSGVQARTQLEAVCTVRPIQGVWVYSPHRSRASEFAKEMSGQKAIPKEVFLATTPDEAVKDADIICTATTSSTPVFDGRSVKPGVHINAIGSFTPEMQEIDSETIRRALVVVDSKEAALAEAGDLLVPIKEGVITKDHIHAELGEILNGHKAGRIDEEQITIFKSVGIAVQDAAAAARALVKAATNNWGQLIDL